MITSDPNLPSFVRPEAIQSAVDLQLVHDLLAGSRTMWQKASSGSGGVPYIFKWKSEAPSTFEIRSRCETLFEGLGRTLSACTGMLFAKPPQVTWNASETAMSELWQNLDGAGTAGPVLVKRFSEASLRDGLGAILVDHPEPPKLETTPLGTITDKVAQQLGLRPTWALYTRSQIINWRTAVVNNRKVLTMVVFAESGEVEDGAFGIQSVLRYRALRLLLTPDGYQATWQLYELIDEKGDTLASFKTVGGGVFRGQGTQGAIADFLPVGIAYTGRTDAPMCATIPLLGVAFANLSHWQQSTDLRFYRMVAAYPQPVVKGELRPDATTGQPGTLGLGPLVAVQVAEGGDYAWAEIQGTSMEQLEKGITEKLKQMAAQGVAFLESETRAAETAEAKRIDSIAQNSTLATAAQGIQDAVNLALEYTAWYLDIEKAGAPVLTINRDFELTKMPSDMLTAYVNAIVSAGMPVRILTEAMLEGGLLPPDTDLDALDAEMMANAQAIEDQKALELEAQANALAQRKVA